MRQPAPALAAVAVQSFTRLCRVRLRLFLGSAALFILRFDFTEAARQNAVFKIRDFLFQPGRYLMRFHYPETITSSSTARGHISTLGMRVLARVPGGYLETKVLETGVLRVGREFIW